jgi:DNA-binding transcriptional regulator YiaG
MDTMCITPYREGISIKDTEGLHKAIGKWLISLPKPLNGAELRFLRLEMDTTQRHRAGIVGATEQTLRLWEKPRKKTAGYIGATESIIKEPGIFFVARFGTATTGKSAGID